MKPLAVAVILFTAHMLVAQQQPSPAAKLYVKSASPSESGSGAPFGLVLDLPGAPVIHFRGDPYAVVYLFAGVFSPGWAPNHPFGSLDLDGSTTLPLLVGLTLDSQGTLDYQFPTIGTDAAALDVGIQALFTDFFSPYGLTLSAAHHVRARVGQFVRLPMGDDTTTPRTLSIMGSVGFYGLNHTSVWVNSNGNVTFGAGDTDFVETLSGMLSGLPRVAALWDDLNPAAGGRVFFDETPDRFRVWWSRVPEYATNNGNSASITMTATGEIALDFPIVAAQDGIVGISPGLNLSPPGLPVNLNAGTYYGTSNEAICEVFQTSPSWNPFDLNSWAIAFQDPGLPVQAYVESPGQLVATIQGPNSVCTNCWATWCFNMSGGIGPYEIEWEVYNNTALSEHSGSPWPVTVVSPPYYLNLLFQEPGSYTIKIWVKDLNTGLRTSAEMVVTVS